MVFNKVLEKALSKSSESLEFRNLGSSIEIEPLMNTLEGHPEIKELLITDSGLKDQEFQKLAKKLETNKEIEKLDFWHNSITANSAESLERLLEKNSTLKTLILGNNARIFWDGVNFLERGLKFNKTLENLDLEQCNIDDEGALVIAQILRSNETIVSLNLKHNSITNEGAKEISLALTKNTNLESLILLNNKFDVDGYRAFVAALETNFSLTKLELYNEIQYKIPSELQDRLTNLLERNKTLSKFKQSMLSLQTEISENQNSLMDKFDSLAHEWQQFRKKLPVAQDTLLAADEIFIGLKLSFMNTEESILFLKELSELKNQQYSDEFVTALCEFYYAQEHVPYAELTQFFLNLPENKSLPHEAQVIMNYVLKSYFFEDKSIELKPILSELIEKIIASEPADEKKKLLHQQLVEKLNPSISNMERIGDTPEDNSEFQSNSNSSDIFKKSEVHTAGIFKNSRKSSKDDDELAAGNSPIAPKK